MPREKARRNIAKQFDLLTLESEEAFSRLVMVASRAIRVRNIEVICFARKCVNHFVVFISDFNHCIGLHGRKRALFESQAWL